MISREEYNKALDIVEAFHKQLFISSVGSSLRVAGKTRLLEWKKLDMCSTRVQSLFKMIYEYENKYNTDHVYIEDLCWQKFKNFRNAGKVAWTDFVEVRGY